MGVLVVALSSVVAKEAVAEVRLPGLFGDHMVLQRDMPIRVWGWAEPKEMIDVVLDGERTATRADAGGEWDVVLPARPAGGPVELRVNQHAFQNVMLGDVWVCAGQSNMEWGLVVTRDHEREIRAANYPRIRLMQVPTRRSETVMHDVETEWRICSPQTVSYFSAVAYFFGRQLHHELDVPMGLIMAAVGGTRIEPWTPAAGVRAVDELDGIDAPANGQLYNGMIHPLAPLSVRGVIWYQGEGNVGDGWLYYHRMRALIKGWRQTFNAPELPFLYVQLAPLNWGGKPVDELPQIWEAQTAALSIPHTGMVVTNDIGNPGDAHPRNKQDVGRRLATWALAIVHGCQALEPSGPLYDRMQVEGSQIRIRFRHAESGLISRDGKPLTWFTIAGQDGEFVPAVATVDGSDVLVSSPNVAEPVAVRFAWHQVAEPNLMNRAGLPASAFRTDRDD